MNDSSGFAVLAQAFDQDPACAAIYVDEAGVIRSWNRAAEAMFGHAAEHAIGSRADLIVPGELHAVHWHGFDRAVATDWPGSEGWGEIAPLHRQGNTVPLEVNLLPIRSATGPGLAGILALFRQPAARA